jgi:acetylornithine aminotransferase
MQLMEGSRRLDVSDVQGRGLLLGYRLRKPAAQVQKALFGHRVLTGTSTDPQVMRLMPPLTFSREEADILLSALGKVLAP